MNSESFTTGSQYEEDAMQRLSREDFDKVADLKDIYTVAIMWSVDRDGESHPQRDELPGLDDLITERIAATGDRSACKLNTARTWETAERVALGGGR